MARILRGDIIWATLDPTVGHEQSGRRPVLVISRDDFNAGSGAVIALALTSQQPRVDFPLAVELSAEELPKRSWALPPQVRILSHRRLGRRIGHASVDELDLCLEGLNEIVGSV